MLRKNNIKIKENIKNIKEYKYLYNSIFKDKLDDKIIKNSLKNTFYSISIYENNKIIGYGRLLGDGICYLHIHNIMVLKEYQHKGIGTLIMNTLLEKVEKLKKINPNLKIYLASIKGKETFYKKFGFLTREEMNMGKVLMLKWNVIFYSYKYIFIRKERVLWKVKKKCFHTTHYVTN